VHILISNQEGGCDVSDNRMFETVEELLTPVWDPESNERCIVCSRPSDGKAICSDIRCAQELARG
jgi:hypothetical protein